MKSVARKRSQRTTNVEKRSAEEIGEFHTANLSSEPSPPVASVGLSRVQEAVWRASRDLEGVQYSLRLIELAVEGLSSSIECEQKDALQMATVRLDFEIDRIVKSLEEGTKR
jgi:hypothetical protein